MSSQLTQEEANALLQMGKYCYEDAEHVFPEPGKSLRVVLLSEDRHEEFVLDITRGRIALGKYSLQQRAKKIVVLARVDIGGAPHRNPDDTEIACPHIHIYREGFDDKWAMPLDQYFSETKDVKKILDQFMDFCHICKRPNIA